MTIHFHTKHYKESGLPFQDYIMCLLYEQRKNWSIRELSDMLTIGERTIIRMRISLVERGYLTREKKNSACIMLLTDKLYPPPKQKTKY